MIRADFSVVEPGFGMSEEALAAYREELLALREEYAGRMNLYIGIELDVLGPIQKAEYAIGSVHALEAARLAAECGFTHTWVLAPGGGFRRMELGLW